MTPRDPTETQTQTWRGQGVDSRNWGVALVCHPSHDALGRTVPIGETSTTVGRGSAAFGDGALCDGHLSRNHFEIKMDEGQPVLTDASSHNGTYVNGARTQRERLAPGDVVAAGRYLFLITHEAPVEPVDTHSNLVGRSAAYRKMVRSIVAGARRGPMLLWGPAGVGKTAMARFAHEQEKREGAFVVARADELAPDELRQRMADPDTATLVLEGIDRLPSASQDVLHHLISTPPSAATPTLIATTKLAAQELEEALTRELHYRLRWVVRVPPLRERLADIPLLVAECTRRIDGEICTDIAPEFMAALLRHSWPGNLHELFATVERATVESSGPPLRAFAEFYATPRTPSLAGLTKLPDCAPSLGTYVVEQSGLWFVTPDGERHSLERRRTLARLLAVLLETHVSEPGRTLGIPELLAKVWPDERLLPASGANRVYVAMASLRKQGLRGLISRDAAGYAFRGDVDVHVELEESKRASSRVRASATRSSSEVLTQLWDS